MVTGYVYVIAAKSGHVKIGKSADVAGRMAALQTACPFPLSLIVAYPCADPRAMEKLLHRRFANKRAFGEWFVLHPEDISHLKLLTEETVDSVELEDFEQYAVMDADTIDFAIDLELPLWGDL